MTEAEWLACEDPTPMLESLDFEAKERKLRLFTAACCRRVYQLYPHAPGGLGRPALEILERYSDGLALLAEVRKAHKYGQDNFSDVIDEPVMYALSDDILEVVGAAYSAAEVVPQQLRKNKSERRRATLTEMTAQAVLLRDIFGNPFRPVTLPPEWRTSTTVALARQMYDSRDFSAMPILADALQDAGCDNADILNHCRGDGPHVRGCWVCDLVLGKE